MLILGGALAAVVVLGVFAALGQHWLSTSVYGPQATAQQFADAEASGDATAALRTLSTPPHAGTVSDAALKYQLARHPISDVKVTVSDVQRPVRRWPPCPTGRTARPSSRPWT